ncbi:BMP family ABC transporter substrate-binding protein [uncultured Sphaerochaeta sp.]|uniref:BMP family lipoprotein n=1 Tax=uncultured Sphaerochaeta sp. TaxID=886478 RepID=UPI0029CA5CC4|nr:BMP family ABC transporter substrate-binding protein [uncultured Sphaerochaeta sp.]
MKKQSMLLVGIFLIVGSIVFGGGSKEAGTQSSDIPRIGVILGVGGLGDMSYNDLMYEGLERAEKELGVPFDYVEPQSIADFETYLQQMASMKTYGVIVSVGYDQVEPLVKVAPQFPNQKFAIIDAEVAQPNVASYVSQEDEGSFLVGVLAGLFKKSNLTNDNNTIGYIAALDIPFLNRFLAGYEAGARYVNPNIKVVADFVGGNAPFSDITTAKEIALKQNSQGIDLIYHAAGGSGLGLFQAAKEKSFYAIGVNSNQNIIEPDHVVASMLKRVDNAAYLIAEELKNGELVTGGLETLGLSSGGVDYTVEGSNIQLSQEIIDTVNEIKNAIIAGELDTPTNPEDVEPFLASNQYQF